ncbi:hypothetical protein Y1Q_0011191 [Alligator mississippiensis]|uniref:KRAB domain-containing protein n=1 Tax=Alligator mississippiensis TaxID=8496 RepID=A0A151MS41_ALLMI|nr:hypothetical protein Y1Q_0011191 [Alligator mississippiensis]
MAAQFQEAFEDLALFFTRKEWELLGDGDKEVSCKHHLIQSAGHLSSWQVTVITVIKKWAECRALILVLTTVEFEQE